MAETEPSRRWVAASPRLLPEVFGEEGQDAPPGILSVGFVVTWPDAEQSHDLDRCRHVARIVIVHEAMARVRILLDVVGNIRGGQDSYGSQVEDFVAAGRLDEVAQYCETDVLNTCRVWLVYELFRGAISRLQLDWSEAQARDFVTSRRTSNPHLMAALGLQG